MPTSHKMISHRDDLKEFADLRPVFNALGWIGIDSKKNKERSNASVF